MLRALGQILLLVVVIVAGSAGLYVYESRYAAEQRLRDSLRKAEQRNDELKAIVTRLTAERRVAEVVVTDQKMGADGVPETTLLFVESARDGESLPPKSFVIRGVNVHVAAQVVKFQRHFVEEGDPLRGRNIALFTAVYGDHQKPSEAERIDRPGEIPDIYRGGDPRVSAF